MTQVFISYSRSDLEFVQRLATDLNRAGLDVWWDLSDIQGSDVWERKIEEGLRNSQYFIVVLTPASLESRWVRREYLSADNKGMRIIPLKLKSFDESPLTLRDIQPINAVDRDYAKVLSDVLKVLNAKMPDLTDVINPRDGTKTPDMPAVSTAPLPMELFDLSGMLLGIIYFILAGLDVLNLLSGDTESFIWGISAILTGFYYIFKRQIISNLPMKVTLIVFLLAHTIVAYSNLTGSGIDFIPSKVEGLSALVFAGLLFLNLRSPKRPAPYSSILFAVFLLLVGTKIFINQFGGYPAGIYTFIILSGIITSIVLWLDQ